MRSGSRPPAGAQDGDPAAKAPPKSARRRSREFAVQGLYQWLVSREDPGAIEAHLAGSPAFQKADREHFQALLHGVVRGVETLHAAIAPNIDRKLEELSPVEHATLLVPNPSVVLTDTNTSMVCSTSWQPACVQPKWAPVASVSRLRRFSP